MKKNRTSDALRTSFKSSNTTTGGFIGSQIRLPNDSLRATMSNETKIREKLQKSIKDLIEQKTTIEVIKAELSKDEYKSYEQYFDLWVENWIIKINPSIKSTITKALKEDRNEGEILREIQGTNSEIYNLYKQYIEHNIQIRIQEKARAEELKNKENKEEAR